jgi:vancomycin permeability regulator SanA
MITALMDIFVVMGAGVGEDGSPSGAMRRRLEAALLASRKSPDAVYVVTGGTRGRKPAEAEVMKTYLREVGVPDARIWPDDESTDTLSSVTRSVRLIKGRPNVGSVTVCSDRYHIPRCRWLFYLLGVRTQFALMPSGREANGTLRWYYYYLREAVSIVVDTLIVFGRYLVV